MGDGDFSGDSQAKARTRAFLLAGFGLREALEEALEVVRRDARACVLYGDMYEGG